MIRHNNPYYEDAVFLTDGVTVIRYRDLSLIYQLACSKLDTLPDMLFPSTKGKKAQSLGIDTTNRFEAILWMSCCWLANIPFIPFHSGHPDPLLLYRPGAVIFTSSETQKKLQITTTPGLKSYGSKKLISFSHPRSESAPLLPQMTQNREHIFCGLLTSGSSGTPKKVPLTRANMIAAGRNAFRFHPEHAAESFESNKTGNEENRYDELQNVENHNGGTKNNETQNLRSTALWGHCLPLTHTGGLTIIFRSLLNGGGIFLWEQFDAETLAHDLRVYSDIRFISLVPTMFKRLTDYALQSGYRPPDTIEQVLTGGGPAAVRLIKTGRDQGWPVTFSYGMTETCGQIAVQRKDGASPPASVGRPFPDHHIKIIDNQHREVPPGTTGSLWIKGPQVFPGYLPAGKDVTELTPANRSNGWFETGDFARLDAHGNLYIEARRTDLIITGGENVSPEEVEDVLSGCPGVSDVGVTAVPDDEWGQRIVVLVVPEPSQIEEAAQQESSGLMTRHTIDHPGLENAIRRYASQYLKPHQRPKNILFTDTLSRTELGKLKRDQLQKTATARLGQR